MKIIRPEALVSNSDQHALQRKSPKVLCHFPLCSLETGSRWTWSSQCFLARLASSKHQQSFASTSYASTGVADSHGHAQLLCVS